MLKFIIMAFINESNKFTYSTIELHSISPKTLILVNTKCTVFGTDKVSKG
mgnify:CR=1 FL=1